MTDDRYAVKVTDVFEGPMDLLIYLIKKNEVDIYDIPIALITDQYLEYLEWMKAMNIDNAGEFIFMAATLAQIKSKMLLPVHDPDDDEDPRMEIARPLLEYLEMKSVAEQLSERDMLDADIFLRTPDKAALDIEPSEQIIRVELFDLIDAFQKILDRVGGDHKLEFNPERFSIKDKIAEIIEILDIHPSVTFQELFFDAADREELIVTFLALLEMTKLNLIRITQHLQSGVIRIFYL